MKTLLITTLLLTTSCAAVPIAGGAFTVVRVSQATNHIWGGEDCSTLTQAAYESKQRGELRGKIEDAAYTAMFLPVDVPVAILQGKPENVGSHGATWMTSKEYLPDLCKVNPAGYGGHKYNGGQDEQ